MRVAHEVTAEFHDWGYLRTAQGVDTTWRVAHRVDTIWRVAHRVDTAWRVAHRVDTTWRVAQRVATEDKMIKDRLSGSKDL